MIRPAPQLHSCVAAVTTEVTRWAATRTVDTTPYSTGFCPRSSGSCPGA